MKRKLVKLLHLHIKEKDKNFKKKYTKKMKENSKRNHIVLTYL